MISQNVKHLTIKQIKALIDNRGVVQDIDKARAQNRPVEYCLESLKAALIERQEKLNHKRLSSPEYITEQINAALSAKIILPPKMPVNFKSVQINTPAKSINTDQSIGRQKRLFTFSGPLWQIEKLSLDERLKIYGA